ncbi:hypothetical protein HY478_01900 [Candidatus Uhrbacteria bacterium]|nr:hypothetical protein [Candidatus Uhrbacteria bacterium]
MPETEKLKKRRQPYMVVDRHDFARRLDEARKGFSIRASRSIMEGRLLPAATVGPIVWAYTARQAVFLRMVRERGHSTQDVYGRFVALARDEWRAQCRAQFVALDPASRATAHTAAAPDVERFIDEALAHLGQGALFPGIVLDPPRPDALWRSKRDRARDENRARFRPRRRRDPGRTDRVEVRRPPSPQLPLFVAARH